MAVEQALLALIGAADVGGAYRISRSLRFNSADSAYLSRTPGSAGNRKTWTFSCWVKRGGNYNSRMDILSTNTATSGNYLSLQFSSGNSISLGYYNGEIFTTSAVYRDFSAWMHVVLALDTTLATAADRVKLYVNGSRVTTFSTDNISSVLTQNSDQGINAVQSHSIGRNDNGANVYFDGYLADVYLLDGTATTPSTFAETDAITGQWVPKTPTGISYGTNGFRLTFSDNSGTTSTTLGKDAAGSNNWTPNNFSVASGSGNDSLVDSPTSYGTDTGAGAEVRGNYCTLNPLKLANVSLSNGNLDWSDPSSDGKALGTIGMSTGKWYWECTLNSANTILGIAKDSTTLTASPGYDANSWAYIAPSGNKVTNSSSSAYGNTSTTGDTIGVAFDADAGSLYFYKNGTIQNSGTAAFTGLTSGPYFPAVGNTFGSGSMNFGQRAFAYTAPSGFKALCDTNLTAPTIAKPANYFDVKLYTGNGSTQTISGLNFGPEFVWYKHRSAASSHGLFDAIRGTSNYLTSNSTGAEQTVSGVTAFTSDGFTLGTDTGGNGSGTWVAWCWDAASSNSTNTSGTITSTVRANATAGFSIVTYTGTGANATIGHGCGAAPAMIIARPRATSSWFVYHASLGATKYLALNSTNAAGTSTDLWNSTAPTSTVFSAGNNAANASGESQLAYCFAPIAGYSAFGSYTGNGSSDGPFVFTGHRSRWLMVKRTDVSDSWYIYDTARNTYNVLNLALYAQSSLSEQTETANIFDVLSNGFKVRGAGGGSNVNGGTYVYASFAEFPFAYARAR